MEQRTSQKAVQPSSWMRHPTADSLTERQGKRQLKPALCDHYHPWVTAYMPHATPSEGLHKGCTPQEEKDIIKMA